MLSQCQQLHTAKHQTVVWFRGPIAIHISEGGIYEIRAAFKAELLHSAFLVCLPHMLKKAATVAAAPHGYTSNSGVV